MRLQRPPAGKAVGEPAGAAWNGLGKVMEYLGHRILAASGPSPVPVQFTAVVVGPGAHGREIVAIDLSEYADPLHKRAVRMPFTAYLKAERRGWIPPPPAALPRLVAIPDPGDEDEGIRIMRDPDLAAAFARHTRTTIPDASRAMEGLIAAYERSELADFHRRFYAQEPDPPELWTNTYDRIDLGALPACVARILEHPNDLLLQPGGDSAAWCGSCSRRAGIRGTSPASSARSTNAPSAGWRISISMTRRCGPRSTPGSSPG